jgi:hypothetical protein
MVEPSKEQQEIVGMVGVHGMSPQIEGDLACILERYGH